MNRCTSCLVLAAALLALAPTSAQQPEPKGGKGQPKVKTDLELFQGTWQIVKLETNGKEESEKNYKGNTFAFSREKSTGTDKAVLREWGHPAIDFTFKLDPTVSPKAIDLTTRNLTTIRGVYKLDGDDLTMCLSVGGARPTEFTTKTGGDTEIFTLRRSKWERHNDKGLGFSVDMPGKPEERKRSADTPAGTKTTTVLVVESDMERVSYLVSVTPLPGKLEGKEADAAIEAAQAALVEEFDKSAKVTESKQTAFQASGLSGTELTLDLELPGSKDKMAMRVRVFILGDRLYALAVAGLEEGTKSNSVLRFWNSFSVPKKKGKN